MVREVRHVGGSFAPPITDEVLDRYEDLAGIASSGPVKDEILKLIEMVRVFRQTPDSSLPSEPHPSGRGEIVPLEDAEIQRIWDHVPWDHEIDALKNLFDLIPADSMLRNPAFHLLWYAVELSKDREPITIDRL